MQNSELEGPKYPFPPFGTRKALAKMLELSIEELDQLERDADWLYHVVEKRKKSGEPRICYNAQPALKKSMAGSRVGFCDRFSIRTFLLGDCRGETTLRTRACTRILGSW